MKVLKGLVLTLLGLLLFISLSAFGLAYTLNSTLLNADFISAEVKKLDIPSLAQEIAVDFIPPEMRSIAGELDSIIIELEPWIDEQAGIAIHSGYDYLLSKSDNINIMVSLEPVKNRIKNIINSKKELFKDIAKDQLREIILASPPSQLAGLPASKIEQYFDQNYDQLYTQYFDQYAGQFVDEILKEIPSSYEIDDTVIPPEVKSTLKDVRQYLAYFQTGYFVLLGFVVLLILLIIAINHEVKGSTRTLGSTFLTYGIIEFAGVYAARYFITPYLSFNEIPRAVQNWIPHVINDLMSPLQVFSLGCLVGGIVLLVVSFVYRREPAE